MENTTESNGVMELIELLHQMVSEAWGIPLGADKCVVERDRVLDILEEIKAQIPGEIEESKKLIAARGEYIATAKREAESIRKMAEEHARQKVSEQEVIRVAKARSNEMISTAEAKSQELRKLANDYADDTLRRTEEAVSTALEELRQSRSRFRAASGSRFNKASDQLAPDA